MQSNIFFLIDSPPVFFLLVILWFFLVVSYQAHGVVICNETGENSILQARWMSQIDCMEHFVSRLFVCS